MATNTHTLLILWETQPPHRRPDLNTKDERLNAKKCETNPIDTPACHPERRAAEQSAAAQSRGTCSNSIAKGDSKQTNPTATGQQLFSRNEPNFTPANLRNEPNSPARLRRPRLFAVLSLSKGQICETNPKQNARHRRATPIFNPGLSAGVLPRPKNAKRTQFPHTKCPAAPCFSETNPIYPCPSVAHDQKCETNPISPRPQIGQGSFLVTRRHFATIPM